MLSSELAI